MSTDVVNAIAARSKEMRVNPKNPLRLNGNDEIIAFPS
jgi:hypothetical protein